jgi:Sulfatase-modifying factor enzyme 1
VSGAIERRHVGSVCGAAGSNRVNRGGSWNNDAANCRTANRNTNEPTNRTNNNGFRLALNSAGKEAITLRVQTEQIVFQSDRVSA